MAVKLAIPMDWFQRLLDASDAQRKNWCVIGCSEGIHWEELDQGVLVEGLL
jgi:hypothetical protein